MRHAQEHWIRLQVEGAMKHANSKPVEETVRFMNDQIDRMEMSQVDDFKEALENNLAMARSRAMVALVEAELYHRRLVSL